MKVVTNIAWNHFAIYIVGVEELSHVCLVTFALLIF